MAGYYQLAQSAYPSVDPEPETPILPEDAPDGIPDKILIEIPIGVTILLPEDENDAV